MKRAAHETLEGLLQSAESMEVYGEVGVDVTFEAGKIVLIRRNDMNTIKPAR
jgi:leucyl aminopeptidase (aminopeptidase T)